MDLVQTNTSPTPILWALGSQVRTKWFTESQWEYLLLIFGRQKKGATFQVEMRYAFGCHLKYRWGTSLGMTPPLPPPPSWGMASVNATPRYKVAQVTIAFTNPKSTQSCFCETNCCLSPWTNWRWWAFCTGWHAFMHNRHIKLLESKLVINIKPKPIQKWTSCKNLSVPLLQETTTSTPN